MSLCGGIDRCNFENSKCLKKKAKVLHIFKKKFFFCFFFSIFTANSWQKLAGSSKSQKPVALKTLSYVPVHCVNFEITSTQFWSSGENNPVTSVVFSDGWLTDAKKNNTFRPIFQYFYILFNFRETCIFAGLQKSIKR